MNEPVLEIMKKEVAVAQINRSIEIQVIVSDREHAFTKIALVPFYSSLFLFSFHLLIYYVGYTMLDLNLKIG